MHISVAGRAAMLAAVMPLLFTGCAEPGPTAVRTSTRSSVVTLDLDAGQFRLDIGERELWHPDGRVVDLEVDETGWLATEFDAQLSLENLAAFTATAYSDSDDQCDWHSEVCEDDFLRAQPAPAPKRDSGPAAPRFLQATGTTLDISLRGGNGDFERTYGKFKIRISRERPGSALRAPGSVVVEFLQGWSCADVRQAMDEARAEALERKSAFGSLLNKVFGWLVGYTFEDGVPRARFGPSARSAVESVVEAAETGRVTLALTMLKGWYQQMGCSGVNGGDSPPMSLPLDWELDCTDIWGTIILPGDQVYTGWYKECVIVNGAS